MIIPIKVDGYKDITTVDEIKEVIEKFEAIKCRAEYILQEVDDIESIDIIKENHMYHETAYELGCDCSFYGTLTNDGSYHASEDIKAEWLLMDKDSADAAYCAFRKEKEALDKAKRETKKNERLAQKEAEERAEYERLKKKFENT
jgi:hypothetical protein